MWTALSLAAMVAAGIAAWLAAAAYGIAHGIPGLAFVIAAPLVYLAIPLVFTSVWFTLSTIFGGPRPLDLRLTLRERIRMFGTEFVALAEAAPRMLLYRVLVPEPPAAPAELPVLFVHGVLCNAGVWTDLRRFLIARGCGPVYAISYGPPLASIERFADQLAARLDAILAATGASGVVLVGHSMGGLVARAYLRRFGGAKVRRLITLGTPHHGSVLSYVFPGACLAQMRPGNRWLDALNAETIGASGVPVVSIGSWHDSMVAPRESVRLEWAENVMLDGVGHNALLGDARVFARVGEEIERARVAV